MHNKVIACIDDSRYAESVCDYATWSAQRLEAPLSLLHVLDEPAQGKKQNLSGRIGFGSQEALLEELASLDEQRAKVAMEHGRLTLKAARERAEAPANIVAGEPETVLEEYQRAHDIDLLIMGAYGHSRIRHLIVGTAMLSKTRISLMVLR